MPGNTIIFLYNAFIFMTIKSSQILVIEALKEIKTITPAEALKLSNSNKCNLIDIREKVS